MRISHKTEETREVLVTDDILCNQCGKSLKDDEDMNYEGLIEARIQGGYASLLGDMVNYTFSICEPCLKKLFKGFKLSPDRDDLISGNVLIGD